MAKCPRLYSSKDTTMLGKRRTNRSAIGRRQAVNEWSPSPKTLPPKHNYCNTISYCRLCRLSLEMFSKHCCFRHNTVSVKTFVLHHLFKWIENTSLTTRTLKSDCTSYQKRRTLTTKSTNFYVSCHLCLSTALSTLLSILRNWTIRAQV